MPWILAAVIVYGALVWGAGRMLYYPMRYPAGNWEARERIGAEDVWIRDGLHGWFIPAPGARFVTLHLHGNGGNITHRTISALHVTQAGSSVLLLDYRGYGRSRGRPTEGGLYEDATAAYDWLRARGYTADQIIVHGESLGTAVATELLLRRPAAALILEAPFTSASAVAGRVMPILGPMLVFGYNAKGKIPKIRVPLLIVHGDADEVIAYKFGQELLAAANEPKQLWTIPGGTHNDLHLSPEFPSRLKAFYLSIPQRSKDKTEGGAPNQMRGDH